MLEWDIVASILFYLKQKLKMADNQKQSIQILT